jgi:hypothetical protein
MRSASRLWAGDVLFSFLVLRRPRSKRRAYLQDFDKSTRHFNTRVVRQRAVISYTQSLAITCRKSGRWLICTSCNGEKKNAE